MHASRTPSALIGLSALQLLLACAQRSDHAASGVATPPRPAAAHAAPPQVSGPSPVQPPEVWTAAYPAVASDGQDFLAVYGVRKDGGTAGGIFTARLHAGPAGALTADPPQLALNDDTLGLTLPAVAWDGEGYVVVYDRFSPGQTRTRALRLGRDGAPIGLAELDLGLGSTGGIACAGGLCWVLVGNGVVRLDAHAWANQAPLQFGSTAYATAITTDGTGLAIAWSDTTRVMMTRLDATGAILDTTPIVVASEARLAQRLALEFSGGSYLVAWTVQDQTWTQELRVRRVAADGSVLGAAPAVVATCDGFSWCAPALVRDASGWRVAWQDQGPAQEYRSVVLLSGVGSDGLPGLPVAISDPLRGPATEPALAGNGEATVAVWAEFGDAEQIMAARLGDVGAAAPGFPISFRAADLPPEQRSPAIDCQSLGLRAAWQERVGTDPWLPAGLDLAPDARWATTEPPALAELDAPYPFGMTRLVAYAATDAGGVTQVWADVSGQPGVVTTPGAIAAGPALRDVTASAFGSAAFLVGWVDGGVPVPSITLQQFSLVPYDPWGPQLQLASGRPQAAPVLGWDGVAALAVWTEGGDAPGVSIRAQRLLAGPSLDALGPQELAASVAPSRAAVAGSGRSWLVAWTERSGGDAQVRARLLGPDGVPSGEVVTLASGAVEGQPPAVVWDGGMYVVGWSTAAGASIRGVGLDEAGGLLTDPFELAPHTSDPGPLGLCSSGPGRVMVVYPDLVPWNGLEISRLLRRHVTTWEPSSLSVRVEPNGMGSVRADAAAIDCGPQASSCWFSGPPWTGVTLAAEAIPGWTFAGWYGACSGDGACAVDLSAGPVEVTARFEQLSFPLEVRLDGSGAGQVWSSSGIDCGVYSDTCSVRLASGALVELTAWAMPGSRFLGWTGPCQPADPNAQYCRVELNEAAQVTATFDDGYRLTVNAFGPARVLSDPAGIDCGSTCEAFFPRGSRVTLTPAPAPGWLFRGWSAGPTVCQDPAACPPVIDLTADTRVDLYFEAGATIDVELWGAGEGRVVSTPEGVECAGTECLGTFRPGQQVLLEAQAATGSYFVGWTSGPCSGQGTCDVTAPDWASAQFEHGPTLSVVKDGDGTGRVVSDLPGIDCGVRCEATFAPWQLVTLTAMPDPGFALAGFSPECVPVSYSACQINAGAAPTVQVSFAPAATLRVTKSGSGQGLVKDIPGYLLCGDTCTLEVPQGSWVLLHATPLTGADVFLGWTGPCQAQSNGDCAVVVEDVTDVGARFERGNYHPLSVTLSGPYGRVTASSPSGAGCTAGTCSWMHLSGTVVTLNASTTSVTAGFTGWSGACSGTSTRCVVSMTQARQVTATFAITRYSITAQVSGAGRVTSSPSGISIGGGSGSYPFLAGTTVKLTATPVPGGRFVSWSGACTGTNPVCTLVANKAQSAFAKFDPGLAELDVSVIGAGSGTVTSDPAGFTCAGYQVSCAYAFPVGTRITLTAAPAQGSYFAGWSGWCTGTEPTCVIDQNSQHGTSAIFQKL